MTQASVGSYDDTPESPVATIIEVPLLWPAEPPELPTSDDAPVPDLHPGPRHQKSPVGRHRANEHSLRRRKQRLRPPRQANPSRTRPMSSRQEFWHTTRVGTVSAVLVLAVFGLAMAAIAMWLP